MAHFLRRLSDRECARASTVVLLIDNFDTHAPSYLYETIEPSSLENPLAVHCAASE
jgi:hypothetical protein